MPTQSDATGQYFKYPKTPHLPYSPHYDTRDDLKWANVDPLMGKRVVITEKLDGENTSLYRDKIHARSIDSAYHPSRAWVKALHGRIAHEIPVGWRICGENLYATHSIHYDTLPSYFMVFAVFDDSNVCLSWKDTCDLAGLLQLEIVPILYQGLFESAPIGSLIERGSSFGPVAEGFVIRNESAFPYSEFTQHVVKYVRPHHVTTDEHWMKQTIIPNGLSEASHLTR